MTSSAELRQVFDSLFIAPYATHSWKSGLGRSHWVELEGWQDSLAGPLCAIAESGNCEYAYARDDWYFAQVTDPASLRTRLLEWHAGLASGVERFAPATAEEGADLEFMQALVVQMGSLIERACTIEHARWMAAPDAAP